MQGGCPRWPLTTPQLWKEHVDREEISIHRDKTQPKTRDELKSLCQELNAAEDYLNSSNLWQERPDFATLDRLSESDARLYRVIEKAVKKRDNRSSPRRFPLSQTKNLLRRNLDRVKPQLGIEALEPVSCGKSLWAYEQARLKRMSKNVDEKWRNTSKSKQPATELIPEYELASYNPYYSEAPKEEEEESEKDYYSFTQLERCAECRSLIPPHVKYKYHKSSWTEHYSRRLYSSCEHQKRPISLNGGQYYDLLKDYPLRGSNRLDVEAGLLKKYGHRLVLPEDPRQHQSHPNDTASPAYPFYPYAFYDSRLERFIEHTLTANTRNYDCDFDNNGRFKTALDDPKAPSPFFHWGHIQNYSADMSRDVKGNVVREHQTPMQKALAAELEWKRKFLNGDSGDKPRYLEDGQLLGFISAVQRMTPVHYDMQNPRDWAGVPQPEQSNGRKSKDCPPRNINNLKWAPVFANDMERRAVKPVEAIALKLPARQLEKLYYSSLAASARAQEILYQRKWEEWVATRQSKVGSKRFKEKVKQSIAGLPLGF